MPPDTTTRVARTSTILNLGESVWQAVLSPMRHLEARGFQDFAKIAKEFPGLVVGAADFGRCAKHDNFRSPESKSPESRSPKFGSLRDRSQDRWEFAR